MNLIKQGHPIPTSEDLSAWVDAVEFNLNHDSHTMADARLLGATAEILTNRVFMNDIVDGITMVKEMLAEPHPNDLAIMGAVDTLLENMATFLALRK